MEKRIVERRVTRKATYVTRESRRYTIEFHVIVSLFQKTINLQGDKTSDEVYVEMRLGWLKASKYILGIMLGIMDAFLTVVFFSIGRGYESFWLSVILILSVVLAVVVLGSWRASKRVETELTS